MGKCGPCSATLVTSDSIGCRMCPEKQRWLCRRRGIGHICIDCIFLRRDGKCRLYSLHAPPLPSLLESAAKGNVNHGRVEVVCPFTSIVSPRTIELHAQDDSVSPWVRERFNPLHQWDESATKCNRTPRNAWYMLQLRTRSSRLLAPRLGIDLTACTVLDRISTAPCMHALQGRFAWVSLAALFGFGAN